MKRILTLTLCVTILSAAFILAQENKVEKPKEPEKSKEVENPKEPPVVPLSNVFKKSNDPQSYFTTIWNSSHRSRGKVFYNPFPDVTDIELGSDEVGKDSTNSELCFPDKIPGEIITKSTNPNNNALTYHYAVTGGKIIGQGEKVIWDLSNVKAGTYTITAAVDDGCGFCGKTVTKTITVKE